MTKSCFIIAVDGTGASGKGTLCSNLADAFDFNFLDTGKMYRVLAHDSLVQKIQVENISEIVNLAKSIDFSRLPSENLYTDIISQTASKISAHGEVREVLNAYQRAFPKNRRGVVVDGRDIGTVIFPEANLKFFITASLEVRAERRFKQLQNMGKSVTLDGVLKDLKERDERDINRKVAPTVAAADAIVIDTSELDADSVIKLVISLSKNAVEEYFK